MEVELVVIVANVEDAVCVVVEEEDGDEVEAVVVLTVVEAI